MLQQEEPRDFVIATGALHTVTDILEIAFGRVGLDWREHTVADCPEHLRVNDVPALYGDPSLARKPLTGNRRWLFDGSSRK